jgi:MFS family permease
LIGALVALHACMAIARVTGSLWLLQNGHGEVVVGVMLALVALAPALLGAPAGAWADRYGLWKPVVIATGLALVGSLATAIWPSVPTLVLAALGTGGAIAVAAVAIQRQVAQQALGEGGSSSAQRMYSWVALGPALSNTASPLLAGVLIDLASHRAAFASAVLMAPIALWLLRAHRRAPRPLQAQRISAKPAWDLLQSKHLRQLLVINLVLASAWDSHSFVVPVLGHAREYSASTIGTVLASFAVAAAAVRLLIIRYAGAWSEQRALRVAMAVTAAMLAIYVLLPGVPGLMLGSAVLGLALGSVQPTVLAALTHATPPERHGQVLGLRMVATNGASVILPMGFGVLAGVAGVGGPLWLMAGLIVAVWPATKALRS